MGEYGTQGFTFRDPAVRHLEEADIPAVIGLYRLNYGDGYPYRQFYDERWYKRGIYNDHIVWLVLEEEGEVVASGAMVLDTGDTNDQAAELGRTVVHPHRQGRGLARRIVEALLDAADDTVEFAFGEARTIHAAIQALNDRLGFAAAGYVPHGHYPGGLPENFVLYANLYGNGRLLRCDDPPQVIPEVAQLARHVLSALGLPEEMDVIADAPPYPDVAPASVQPLDRGSLARLVRIEHGRVVEPLLFGAVSLEQGLSHIRRREAVYRVALDEQGHPVGALGYRHHRLGRSVRGVELVARDPGLRGHLCGLLVREAEALEAHMVEAHVSAYDARLQRTFADHGFHPVAYLPSMAFHNRHRLDVVRMLKLNVPYQRGEMVLTEPAEAVVRIVEAAFTNGRPQAGSAPGD